MSQEKERLSRDFLKEDKIIKLLGIPEGTLERLVREKNFPYIKIGQKRLFYEPDVVKYLKLKKKGFNSEENE
ncbi:excisionase family DNA-binding protein [bacterium]|nr:excisionase family DNA-binding protein [bacterium]